MNKADGKPGGARTAVQFNDAGAFAGAPSLTYDNATDATLFQGQANHNPALSAERLVNPTIELNADGWTLGAGWAWTVSPFPGEPPAFIHDPLETAFLYADAPVANTGEIVLVAFVIEQSTQGTLGISMATFPSEGTGDSYAIIGGNGNHLVSLYAGVDGSQLIFNPQPGGTGAIFDGLLTYLSVKRIIPSDPLLFSKLANADPGSILLHLGNLSNIFFGWLSGSGISPDSSDSTDNLALGTGAMEMAWKAKTNVAIGSDTIRFAPLAENNVAVGAASMRDAQEVQRSVGIGQRTLFSAYQGIENVAIGDRTFSSIISGRDNVGIGSQAGSGIVRGNGNVMIGPQAGNDLSECDYKLRISHYITDPVALIAGDFQAQTLTIGGDLDFSDDAKGPILIDRTTATRYRLFVDGGVLSIEVA